MAASEGQSQKARSCDAKNCSDNGKEKITEAVNEREKIVEVVNKVEESPHGESMMVTRMKNGSRNKGKTNQKEKSHIPNDKLINLSHDHANRDKQTHADPMQKKGDKQSREKGKVQKRGKSY